MNKNASRSILLGISILLLVILRMVTASADLQAAPGWEQGDQEGVAQVLASATARAIATLEPAGYTAQKAQTPTPLASSGNGTDPSSTPEGSPADGKKTNAQDASRGEVFMTMPETERTLTPGQAGVPVHIAIPAVGIDAPVVPSKSRLVLVHADVFTQWIAPDLFAGGWITSSALLGEKGNTVISGHHNDFGEVFGRLVDVNVGDSILVYSSSTVYRYKVTNRMILQEVDVPDDTRLQNARWIGRSADERLTLVTCWPKDSNTHRLILVAVPD